MSVSEQARRLGATTAPQPDIGGPITFAAGPFAGHTLRAELDELQKADLGRKYARKDRRPLDPPPVIQLKLFEVYNPGTGRYFERELENYDEVRGFGILCHVDLFPVPAEPGPVTSRDQVPRQQTHPTESPQQPDLNTLGFQPPLVSPSDVSQSPASSGSYYGPSSSHHRLPANYYSNPSGPYSMTPSPTIHSYSSHSMTYHPYSSVSGPPSVPPPVSLQIPGPPPLGLPNFSAARPPTSRATPSDVVAYFGDFSITEASKCTEALVGATFVQNASVEYKGRSAMMFVFSDLAVKMEGSFILRYRVFSLYSRAEGDHNIPILAECYGGRFKIYSTKEFPGLRASTDLTKHLALYGVRLNLRESERRRRRTQEAGDADDAQVFNRDGPSALIHSPSVPMPSMATSSSRATVTRGDMRVGGAGDSDYDTEDD
ncbi:hypothetical protein CERSUDRAFT_123888 [Gelatoporia subvermispora B]|uniref:Velvet domain-containing protein n=1 Tax=Ceriporiopsis subvermispora (strain B) TaxID=914234 RepID=M2RDF1_CERS8|nr:hypothetical protein CERSUDRAFT_123888 [Gelatoporia subvermispora B]